ncbi:MAG: CPBP family intramembrane metalloprotease [Undibacterium sp.]|nr:CPBP family intramembrane metalloprotease [Opitutaceae bacterium]
MNHPLLLILMTGVGLYCARLWRGDMRARPGKPGAMPGAEPATPRAIGIAVTGALVILGLETWGETVLGLAAEQSRMTALFAVYSVVAAPVIEEIIFRGFFVVESRRRALVWAGAAGASVLFAALHPFLWRWDEAGFAWTPNAKGAFSTGVVFATSLWLYAARLGRWNPRGSLLPCFAAHAAKNLGVVAIKAWLGFLDAA